MLNLKSFVFNPFQENTYILHDETKAWIIDPGMYLGHEKTELNQYIRKHHLHVEKILLTHAHIDHILGLDFLCREWNLLPYMHHLEEINYYSVEQVASLYGIPNVFPGPEKYFPLNESATLSFNNIEIEVRFVPGHSPGHVAFIIHELKMVISGDVIFYESIGRTDLPGGNFEQLEQSIKTQLYVLPDDYTIYPGHGPSTTIGHEKKRNPFVRP